MQRVLVVEDSKVVQQVLRHLSSQYIHAEIDFALSLEETQEYLSNNQYTLALVDLTLPDAYDGEVVELTLKEQVPTVVLTSKIDEYFLRNLLTFFLSFESMAPIQSVVNFSIPGESIFSPSWI